jgi:lysophospholipase
VNHSNSFEQVIDLENSEGITEKILLRYKEVIIPFYKVKGISEQFIGVGEIPIACRTFLAPNPVAKIILCTGYNESYLKYTEFIMNLCEMGFSVYCYDHRGQGFSGRFPNQEKRGFVDNFANYVDDLCYFFENVSATHENQLPIFIIAHSMGGAICSLAISEKKINPNAVVLCSPMFEIMLTPFHLLEYPIYILILLLCKFNLSKKYAMGQTDCIPFRPFEGNDVTHSKARYAIWRKHISEIDEMQLGGPTYGWLKESIAASRKARCLSKQNNIPILLLQAGEDTVVRNSAQNTFHKNSSCCNKIFLDHARHEILMEVDSIRNKAIDYIKKFIFDNISSGSNFNNKKI